MYIYIYSYTYMYACVYRVCICVFDLLNCAHLQSRQGHMTAI